MKSLLLAVVALGGVLPAQKLAMTDGSGREVVMLDVGDLLPENRELATQRTPAERNAATLPTDLQRLAAFVRTFAAPLAEPGADLQPLGDRHLVVLGSPAQVAAAERLVAHAKKARDQQFLIDVRLCEMPARIFDQEVAPLLPAPRVDAPTVPRGPQAAVLDAEAARALLVALKKSGQTKITQFPQVVAPSLLRAKLMVGKQLTYVRDFEVDVATAAFVLTPVHDVLFDGHDVEVLCGETRDGTIGVQMQLVDQVVEQPIPERTTTLPGSTKEVTVQVPRVTGCRGSQIVEMTNGATAIMAARKNDGSWLVTLMTPQKIGPPAPLPGRR